ncbi:MAG: tetratricopeptide repeat protein [Pseudomonadota bacterium]
MQNLYEILQSEIERLFTFAELKTLVIDYLALNEEALGGEDLPKPARAKRIIQFCLADGSIDALVDSIVLLKGDSADPRIGRIHEHFIPFGVPVKSIADDYDAGIIIAEGGTGIIVSAKPKTGGSGDEDYVIKFTRPELARYRRGVARYLAYLRRIKANKVKGIADIIKCGTVGNEVPYVVMRRAKGASFSSLIEKGGLDFEKVADILLTVCGILIDLHSAGLVHGALKPSRIFVSTEDDQNEVTILPSGNHLLLFHPYPDVAGSGYGTGGGSALYMSPDQIRGEQASPTCDIYNFGLLAYEAAVRAHPFGGKNAADLLISHLRKEIQPPTKKAPRASIPSRFDDLVFKCLEKIPSKRPASMAAVRSEFEGLMSEERVSREMAAGVRSATVEELEGMGSEFLENPEVPELAEEIINLARGAKAWEKGIELFNKAIESTEEKDVKTDLLYRLASVYEKDIRDHDEAATCYRRILDISPDEEVAEAGIMDSLRQLGRYEDLVVLILDKIDRTDVESEKNSFMREVAKLYDEEMGEPAKALLVLLPQLQTDPFDKDIVDSIGRLAEATNGWEEVFKAANNLLKDTNLPAGKAVAICNTAAKWYAEKLGRTDVAVPYYQKALSLAPSDETALSGMAKILKSKGEHKELINVLERLVDVKPAGIERIELKMQVASAYQYNLNDINQAETVYNEILEEDPLYDDAFTALEKILTENKRWRDLSRVARKRIDHIEDQDRKVKAMYALAETRETRLNDVEGAIKMHKEIIELKPDYNLSLKALELLLTQVGDMKELASVLEKQTDIASTPKQKFDLFMRRSAIYEEEFIEIEKSLDLVNKAVEIDPKSLVALNAKSRLLKKLERYAQLLDVLEKEIQLEESNEVKTNLLTEQARILVEKFNKYDDAMDKMQRALEIGQGKKSEILSELIKICELSSNFEECVIWLEQLCDEEDATGRKAEICVRIGDIQKAKLDEAQASLKSYQRALDYDSGNIKATNALKAVFTGRGDHGAALSMLEKEIAATEGAMAKSKLYGEMGMICREDLKDPKKAMENFKKAFELDKTNVMAGENLAELYRTNDKWDEAIKIFEHFAASATAMKKEKALELFLRYGEAALTTDDFEKAKSAFSRAREIDPRDGYALERFARSVYAMKDWKAASTAYSDYLLRFSDTLEKEDKISIHLKLAASYRELDELPRAVEMLGKTLELDPECMEAYRMRAAIHEKKDRWEETVEDLRKIMEFVDDKERFGLLVKVGDILTGSLQDEEKAAKSYQAALEIEPEDRATLIKLMQIFMNLEKWQKVVEVVLNLADLVEDKRELATYYKTAASLCDQYLGRKDDALSYYELAIENDPSQLNLLDFIANILTEKNEWHTLERTYRKMLDKIPEGVEKEVKANLWHKLAELYLHRLDRTSDAVSAFETALKLDPTQRRWMESLADLYGDDQRYSDKAIALNREILQLNPYRIESYKTICRIFRKKGRYDESWCVASTLSALSVEDDDVLELYGAYKSEEPSVAYERVSEEMWSRYLVHPSVDEKITGIFKILEPAILKAKAQSPQAANLKPEQQIEPRDAHEMMPSTFHYAAGVINVPLPPFYLWRDDRTIGIIFTPTYPPAIVVGGEALKEENTQTLAYVAARHLTYYLPGYYLRVFLQTGTSLSTWLLSAIKFIIPQFPLPGEYKARVPDAVSIMKKHLDQGQKDLLAAKIGTFMESVSGGIDLKKWAIGVDYTADRAGLLLCNDMGVAISVIRKLQVDSWFAPVKDRMAELSLFSVSDEFFVLREKLGIAIQTE